MQIWTVAIYVEAFDSHPWSQIFPCATEECAVELLKIQHDSYREKIANQYKYSGYQKRDDYSSNKRMFTLTVEDRGRVVGTIVESQLFESTDVFKKEKVKRGRLGNLLHAAKVK